MTEITSLSLSKLIKNIKEKNISSQEVTKSFIVSDSICPQYGDYFNFCPSCAYNNTKNDFKFCPNCGTSLELR